MIIEVEQLEVEDIVKRIQRKIGPDSNPLIATITGDNGPTDVMRFFQDLRDFYKAGSLEKREESYNRYLTTSFINTDTVIDVNRLFDALTQQEPLLVVWRSASPLPSLTKTDTGDQHFLALSLSQKGAYFKDSLGGELGGEFEGYLRLNDSHKNKILNAYWEEVLLPFIKETLALSEQHPVHFSQLTKNIKQQFKETCPDDSNAMTFIYALMRYIKARKPLDDEISKRVEGFIETYNHYDAVAATDYPDDLIITLLNEQKHAHFKECFRVSFEEFESRKDDSNYLHKKILPCMGEIYPGVNIVKSDSCHQQNEINSCGYWAADNLYRMYCFHKDIKCKVPTWFFDADFWLHFVVSVLSAALVVVLHCEMLAMLIVVVVLSVEMMRDTESETKPHAILSTCIFVLSTIIIDQWVKYHVVINAFFQFIGHGIVSFLTSSAFYATLPVLLIGALMLCVVAVNQFSQNKAVDLRLSYTPKPAELQLDESNAKVALGYGYDQPQYARLWSRI